MPPTDIPTCRALKGKIYYEELDLFILDPHFPKLYFWQRILVLITYILNDYKNSYKNSNELKK